MWCGVIIMLKIKDNVDLKKLAKKYSVDVLLVIKRIKEIQMLYSIEE